jgi:MFS family permease
LVGSSILKKAYPVQSEADIGPWGNTGECVIRLRLAVDRAASLDRDSCGASQKEWATMIALAVFVSLSFFYSLSSQRLERTIVTAPIAFTVAGMLISPALPGILKAGVNAEVLFRLSEIGLVMATVSALPYTLFTLPAGAIADMVDRKKILLAVQLWHASIAIALAILWMTHLLNPYLILASAFLFSGRAPGIRSNALRPSRISCCY